MRSFGTKFLSLLTILGGSSVLAEAQSRQPAGPTQKATFAGGCFWCMEPPFEKLKGISEVLSGYMGGSSREPTYENYAAKGHIEVVQSAYDL